MARILDELKIAELTVAERLELIGELWDSLTEAEVPVPEWHKQEIERRLAADEAAPHEARPWEDVRRRLLQRS